MRLFYGFAIFDNFRLSLSVIRKNTRRSAFFCGIAATKTVSITSYEGMANLIKQLKDFT